MQVSRGNRQATIGGLPRAGIDGNMVVLHHRFQNLQGVTEKLPGMQIIELL